jgi:hypothetical protein
MTTQILKSGVERIEIGGAWYDLRRAVGWYQLEATSELAAIKMTLPVRIANRMSNLDDLDPDTPVGLEIRQHERTLARLSDRIAVLRPADQRGQHQAPSAGARRATGRRDRDPGGCGARRPGGAGRRRPFRVALGAVIRNSIVYGLSIERGGYDDDEWQQVARACQAINEWMAVKNGYTTYQALGYDDGRGGVCPIKLHEAMVIESEVSRAQRDRAAR